jgi:hypothetical protein
MLFKSHKKNWMQSHVCKPLVFHKIEQLKHFFLVTKTKKWQRIFFLSKLQTMTMMHLTRVSRIQLTIMVELMDLTARIPEATMEPTDRVMQVVQDSDDI